MAVFPLTLFGQKIFAAWAVDYVLALGFGIFFQYFNIAPMRGLGFRDGIKAAFKADTLSLTAWQVGMYGWMAIAVFVIFGHELSKNRSDFLVHDADRDAGWISDQLSGELVAAARRNQ